MGLDKTFWTIAGALIMALICLPFGGWAMLLGLPVGAGLARWRIEAWQHLFIEDPVLQRAFFRLLGHGCKLSGSVQPEHIQAVQAWMRTIDLSLSEQQSAISAFNMGKQGVDAPIVAARLRQRVRAWDFRLWLGLSLVRVVKSAYQTTSAERHLANLLELMGLPSLLAASVKNPPPKMSQQAAPTKFAQTPWTLLGVTPSARGPELKTAYRRAMAAVHPDKIAAQGGSQDEIEIAKQKSQAIQEAWAKVKHLAR